jgi:proteic killer suppression protein
MIRSFADKHTSDLFFTGKSRRLPPDLIPRAIRRLDNVDLAKRLDDLRIPASNRLHALHGDRKGQHAIFINKQWRVCFRFEGGNAYEVEVTDYH